MKYLSVCSGIEAATAAWHSLGWEPEAFAEIDAFPSAVLKHHYPEVPNLGDMTKFEEWNIGPIDLLVGGTPCQSFSVAGLRAGLDDPRGDLMLGFLAIARRHRPRWLVWENVPGVLSSNGGEDFACLLRGLAELGYGWCYRVLDAQYWGVAQRRRRVFLVGCLGDWHPAAAVLLERSSLSGHPAPSREKREGAAPSPVPGVANCLTSRMHKGINTTVDEGQTPIVEIPEVMCTLRSSGAGFDRPGNAATEHETYLPVAFSVREDAIAGNFSANELEVSNAVTALRPSAQSHHAQTFIAEVHSNVAPTLTASNDPSRSPQSSEITKQVEAVLAASMAVRRLTPVECSRLQGFPDDYLELKYANADEAHAAQILHHLWREIGKKAFKKQEWRTGVLASLLTPQILFTGVYVGWICWEVARECLETSGSMESKAVGHQGLLQALRVNEESRSSPYQRESFRQLARELDVPLSELPYESTQARAVLRSSRLWSEAQRAWPLRYAFASEKERQTRGISTPDGPRYRALGNSMAVPVMNWIGKRINQVEKILDERREEAPQ